MKRILCLGSPPHMRGKGDSVHAKISFYGITPAHAGKRARPQHDESPEGDHPRTCGEKSTVTGAAGLTVGSPPHMRGKVPCVV